MKLLAMLVLACLILAAVGWSLGAGDAEEPQEVGRYQAAAPDLVLDTMTGRLTDSKGVSLSPVLDASEKQVGRYSAAGYVAVITRFVGLNIVSQPYAQQELVKGYSIVDTKTGQVVKQKIYASQPIAANELQSK